MLENDGVALKSIRWSEIFPWLSIGKSFRLALSLRLLVYGAAALLLTLLSWWFVAVVLSHDGELNQSWTRVYGRETAWQVVHYSVPDCPSFLARRPFDTPPFSANPERAGILAKGGETLASSLNSDPLGYAWSTYNRPVVHFFSSSPDEAMSASEVIALVLSGFCALAIWAFFGAAICRVAAVELATGERVGWGESLRWACDKWLAYFASPLIPMIGVGLAVVPVFVLGILMKSGFLAILGGAIWPLVLLAAFAMTLLLAGVLLGWPLMWATISVEGTDSFDALSRTYAYVFQKPLRYLLYIIIAAIVGALGWIVVENFAAAVVWLAAWSASWGTGAARMKELLAGGGDSSLSRAGVSLVFFWNGCVKLLALGYVFSYFGVASTAVYYQMRRDVDARETDEVFLDADKSEQAFGLPNVQTDAAGAPELAASPAPPAEADPETVE